MISNEQLKEILGSHKEWLNRENGVRAILCMEYLCGANLCGVDLRRANLHGADLREANLYGASLRGADLYGADLYGANLCNANLRGADLCKANLHGADLRKANLCKANLHGADLREANLHGVNLYGADIFEAKIDMDEFNKICPLCCPETGAFVGWKKAGGYIVKLKIPEDALRSSATTNKCRCSKAKVLAIENLNGSVADVCRVSSDYDSSFVYEVGKTVEVKNFDRDRKNECAPGIHFFCDWQEAVEYQL